MIAVRLSACALVLLAACETRRSPTQPTPTPLPPGPVVYTALGASDALGVGASVPCLPLVDCPGGTGYVQVIARRLGAGRQVTLRNLGIPAGVIGPRFQDLGARYGRTIPGNFVERAVPFVLSDSTLVTIFAGGNDANTVGAAIEGGAAGADVRGYIDRQSEIFREDYDALIRGVRERAGAPRIVVANLPNFAALPFTASYSLQRKQVMQRITVGFSTEVINRLTAQGVIVLDLLCDSRAYLPSNYSSDGFHPNDAGYLLLADLFLAAIEAPSYPSPRAGCPEMTFVPAL